MKEASKVVFNTGILYLRMFLTVGVTLYTTRLVLLALGSNDYGIYQLTAGTVAMLAFLNNAMATSTQRFLSYYQGKKDIIMQKKVFANSFSIHLFIGLIIVIIIQVVGNFLFDGILNIEAERVNAAKTVYICMSVSVFFTVITVPFTGTLIARENMIWVALINILETLLKLGIALYLLVVQENKLETYGFLTAGVSAVCFLFYSIFCFRKFPECKFHNLFIVDKKHIKELASFAGWNLFGALCGIGRTQGLAIFLNIFIGAVANAAYGLANQIAAQMVFFSSTMLRAINPQIMKSEGAGNREKMLRLSMIASKFGFYLLSIFAIPCIFEMESILTIWLKNVPEQTVIFSSLILVSSMINQSTVGLQSAIQATGKIKVYQSIVGSILLLNLPVAFFLLKMELPIYSVLLSYIIIETIACIMRIYMLTKYAGLSVKKYVNRVFLKELIPLATIILTSFAITSLLQFDYRFILTISTSAFMFTIAIYNFGLCVDEKIKINQILNSALGKLKKFQLKTTNY
jgi:O-antigen/teichoic acid export membrane protein